MQKKGQNGDGKSAVATLEGSSRKKNTVNVPISPHVKGLSSPIVMF